MTAIEIIKTCASRSISLRVADDGRLAVDESVVRPGTELLVQVGDKQAEIVAILWPRPCPNCREWPYTWGSAGPPSRRCAGPRGCGYTWTPSDLDAEAITSGGLPSDELHCPRCLIMDYRPSGDGYRECLGCGQIWAVLPLMLGRRTLATPSEATAAGVRWSPEAPNVLLAEQEAIG